MPTRIECRFDGEVAWRRIDASSEHEAAHHMVRLVASTCPVPGAYRAGAEPARLLSPHRWLMPTGAIVVTRTVDD